MRKRSATYAVGDTLDDLQEEFTDEDPQQAAQSNKNKVVMTGWLYKTTRLKTSKTRGHQRQHRRFRLTAHSLEYDQLFQKVQYMSI